MRQVSVAWPDKVTETRLKFRKTLVWKLFMGFLVILLGALGSLPPPTEKRTQKLLQRTWLCRNSFRFQWCPSGPFAFVALEIFPELGRPQSELWRHVRVGVDTATENPAEGFRWIESAACQDQRGSKGQESHWKQKKIEIEDPWFSLCCLPYLCHFDLGVDLVLPIVHFVVSITAVLAWLKIEVGQKISKCLWWHLC